ncbi:MAG: biopolymer transporter ExbD [Sandaracinaceae bacterium]|nr:biopolymer transporter ExbD [Sandaracinaceae bacterium]
MSRAPRASRAAASALVALALVALALVTAARAAADPDPSVLSVLVHRDGRVEIDGRAVALDAVEARARAHVAAVGDAARAVIAADRRVAHGRVVDVVDRLRRAGIARISFAVEPASAPRSP